MRLEILISGIRLLCLIPLLSICSCTSSHLSDKKATRETYALYESMRDLVGRGTMFGAQMPTIHGISQGKTWYAENTTDRSDTKDISGSHPALCGWEIGGIELRNEENLDGDSFDVIRRHIIAAYERGAVNTISWHCGNPVTGGRYNDTSESPIRQILPGGIQYDKFVGYLDAVADFLLSLKTAGSVSVPVIFRPWHEHTDTGKGTGFWWSVGNNSKNDFVALWKMTFHHLTDVRGVHNLIWAYSPDLHHLSWDRPGIDKYMYLDAWPGDGYVDIMGLDAYETPWSNFRTQASDIVDYAISLAKEKGKIFAITETGLANNNPLHQKYGSDPKWWTEQLYRLSSGKDISYVMIWRDDFLPETGEAYPEYYGCFDGAYSTADFIEYVSKEDILLEEDLPNMYD